MPALTITNASHGTYAIVRVSAPGHWHRLSPSQVTRIRNTLCNRPDCECRQSVLCESGPQDVEITTDTDGIWIYASPYDRLAEDRAALAAEEATP